MALLAVRTYSSNNTISWNTYVYYSALYSCCNCNYFCQEFSLPCSVDYSNNCLPGFLLWTKPRTGWEATCKMNWPSMTRIHGQALMTLNHLPVDLWVWTSKPPKTAGGGLLEKLKGSTHQSKQCLLPEGFPAPQHETNPPRAASSILTTGSKSWL